MEREEGRGNGLPRSPGKPLPKRKGRRSNSSASRPSSGIAEATFVGSDDLTVCAGVWDVSGVLPSFRAKVLRVGGFYGINRYNTRNHRFRNLSVFRSI